MLISMFLNLFASEAYTLKKINALKHVTALSVVLYAVRENVDSQASIITNIGILTGEFDFDKDITRDKVADLNLDDSFVDSEHTGDVNFKHRIFLSHLLVPLAGIIADYRSNANDSRFSLAKKDLSQYNKIAAFVNFYINNKETKDASKIAKDVIVYCYTVDQILRLNQKAHEALTALIAKNIYLTHHDLNDFYQSVEINLQDPTLQRLLRGENITFLQGVVRDAKFEDDIILPLIERLINRAYQ
jgi:predicted acetyltransferase